MAKMLQEAHAKIDHSKISYHLNSLRAEGMKLQVNQTAGTNEQYNARGQYANELLRAGKTHEAIMEIERLAADLENIGAQPRVIRHVKRLLAQAYIRLGEQENCIGKNNAESCILPIKGEGVYNLRKGSETAISICNSILEFEPEDMETVWLLNLAYMTLGEYPSGVPAKFRIPEKHFRSNGKATPFDNITNQLNLGTVALAGGACVEDFNNDGLLDIMASSWGIEDPIQLFYNNGDGTFKNVSDQTKLEGITGGLNMMHTDYNNDGWMDVLVLRGAWFHVEGKIPNSLLRNNGDGTFTDVTIEAGLLSKWPTQAATWQDFNNDGWIDLFIGNETSRYIDCPYELYINENGKFSNQTAAANVNPHKGVVKGVCSGDINNDGWSDIYISIVGQPNVLLQNNGVSDGGVIPTFKEITQSAGVGEPLASFPTWMFDFNNDGYLDIFAACFNVTAAKIAQELTTYYFKNDYNPSPVHIYQNKGNGTFEQVAQKMGVVEPAYVMGSNFGDIDNDGSLDFYLGTGAPSLTAIVPNKMYRNNKGHTFEDVTSVSRLGHIQKGHGVSFGDLDNDGDQDIFHVIGGAYEGDVFSDALFENTSDQSNNWITIKLVGANSNRAAIGARIKLICSTESGKKSVFHRVVSTGGSFGASSLQQEIGIGKATRIESITIKWPNKDQITDVYSGIEPNRFIEIEEGAPNVNYLDRKKFDF